MKKWKENELKLNEMFENAVDNLYDRIVLANEIFSDPEFRVENGFEDDGLAAKYLNKWFADHCVAWSHPFFELKAMLQKFPNRQDWKNTNIAEIHASTLAQQPEEEKKSRASVKVQDHEAIKKTLANSRRYHTAAKNKIEKMEQLIKEKDEIIEQLEKENADLLKENIELKQKLGICDLQVMPS